LRSLKDRAVLEVRKGKEISLSAESVLVLLRAVLERGVPFRFRAKGFSMSPFIRDGDIITIHPLAGKKPGTGEVVAFLHPKTGKVAVHRIIRKSGDGFCLKGDNIPDMDGLVPRENILGFVKHIERRGKRAYLGLGPERRLIARVSGWKPFVGLVAAVRKLAHSRPRGKLV